MRSTGVLESIAGSSALHDWFGYWPTFHDAEIHEFSVCTNGPGRLGLLTWHMTDRTDERGYYINEKHVLLHIVFDTAFYIETSIKRPLANDCCGIVDAIEFRQLDEGIEMELFHHAGLNGLIRAKNFRFEIISKDPHLKP